MSERLTPFDANNPDAERVLLWMQAGLDGYLEENAGRWAFRPFEHYIGVRDDLAEDLSAIYEDLAPYEQGLWRSAIRSYLATQGRDPSHDSATRVLIDLAALIRAHEVLDVLPTLVAGRTDSLLDQVVQTAVALASQTDASRACLERIRTSPSFSPDYAGLVLLALCHADPDGWLGHVENLARPMNVLANRLEHGSTALRFYANGILDAISLSRVHSTHLRRLGDIGDSMWLLNEWLSGSSSLLRYEAGTELGPRLLLRANSAVSVKLDEPLAPLLPSAIAQHDDNVDVVIAVLNRAGQHKTWVAGYRGDRVTELSCMDSYHDALDWLSNYMRPYMRGGGHDFSPSQLKERPRSVAVAFLPSRNATHPRIVPIGALVDTKSLRTSTQRLQYFQRYSKQANHTRRRDALDDRRAGEAIACAIRLAEEEKVAAA